MKAMILAAGLGVRLRPLTDRIPKPLLEIGGKPIIDWAIERLASAGIDQIAINVSHLADQIIQHLGDGSALGVRISYFREANPTGTGGGVLAARSFLESETEIVVVNADTYQEIDWRGFIEFHRRGGYSVSLALREAPGWESYGGVWRASDGRVVSIVKDPSPTEAIPHIFTGAWVWTRPPFGRLEAAPQPSCLIRHAAMPMLAEEKPIGGYRYDGPWHDLGTPERLEKARSELDRLRD